MIAMLQHDRVDRPTNSWHEHRVVIVNGTRDTRLKSGEDYATTKLTRLFDITPSTKPKNDAFALIPSIYADHDARCHYTQERFGCFVALCVDVDHGNHDLAIIQRTVKSFASDAAWLIYSTASATADDRRWRVILPLDQSLNFEQWRDLQVVFTRHMIGAGVELDCTLQRAGQLAFLPNVPRDRRDAAGIPLFFQTATTGIHAPGLMVGGGPIAEAISRYKSSRKEEERQPSRLRVEVQGRRAVGTARTSLIGAFNEANPLPRLLVLYHYEEDPQHPGNWRSPLQESGTYATKIMADGKWFSLSGSDGAAGLGSECRYTHSGRYGDAFDLFTYFENGGDRLAALRAIREGYTSSKENRHG